MITQQPETIKYPSSVRMIETRFLTSIEGRYLTIKTANVDKKLHSRVGRVVIAGGFVTETPTDYLSDPAPVSSVIKPLSRYSQKQLVESHEQFLAEMITEENLPALLEWAERA